MLRVLVCDDSATCRMHLASVLRTAADLTVVGEARDGREAVRLATALRPDVIVMDLWMPDLDGLGATREVMTEVPTPVVIVTASAAVSDVAMGMEALRAGALTLIPKPVGGGTAADAARLISTVRTMAGVKVVRQTRPGGLSDLRPPLPPGRPRVRGVAVASSTGGPGALQLLLGGLPAGFAAPVLVVQHISPGFAPGLVAWLGTVCPLRVKLADHGEPLRPGTVYVAPDGHHLGPAGAAVELTRTPAVGGFRPSGTVLFEAAARAWGAGGAAVILTGMGDDGVAGLAAVRKAGGVIFGQDEKSCVVYGMPGAAAAAGLVDHALPPEKIGARLWELVKP